MAKHTPIRWKSGDRFEDANGSGWDGNVIGMDGSQVVVHYNGETIGKYQAVDPSRIRRPETKTCEKRH